MICIAGASAQQTSVLVDLGFSLSTEENGRTRLDELEDELSDWLSERPPDERYELLIASHLDTVELRTPDPVAAQQLQDLVSRLRPWGTVELLPAIDRTIRGMRSQHLLILTDGQDISSVVPTRVPEIPDSVEVSVLAVQTRGPGTIHEILSTLQTRSAPVQVDDEAAEPPAMPPATSAQPESVRVPDYRDARSVTVVTAWVIVALLLAAGILLLRRERAFRRERVFVKQNNTRPPVLLLDIRSADASEQVRVETYPAQLGPEQCALPHEITLRYEKKRFLLETETPVRINGMERREYELGRGDQFRAGHIRVFVDAIEKVPWKRPPRPEHRPFFAAPAVLGIFTLLLFWYSLPVGYTTVAVSRDAAPAPVPTLEPAPEPETVPDPDSEPFPSGFSRAPDAPEVTDFRTPARELTAPDELPAGPIDFLAIHAHPDDEALYFGSLLPRLRGLGMRGVVLVFTDGESGLDQHPWRSEGGMYPGRRMSGAELATVRRVEAARAIGALGADYYVRLGLSNAPYSSVLDVVGVDAVLDRWGGEESVVGMLSDIIRVLQPRVVIAPDGPGPALEHFEHQAVGVAVRSALETLDTAGTSPVEAFIIGTDPRQPDGYADHPNRVLMDPWQPAADGRIPRIDQIHALWAHQTQRDATVVGVQARLTLLHDFYLVYPENNALVRRIFDTARVE